LYPEALRPPLFLLLFGGTFLLWWGSGVIEVILKVDWAEDLFLSYSLSLQGPRDNNCLVCERIFLRSYIQVWRPPLPFYSTLANTTDGTRELRQ
jgi:hypothetical protein